MIAELDTLDPLLAELRRLAAGAGTALVCRAQVRTVRHVVVRAGRTEEVTSNTTSGIGVQVYTPEGHTALASRDGFEPEPVTGLFHRALDAARAGGAMGLQASASSSMPVARERRIPASAPGFGELNLEAVAQRLAEIEREIARQVPGPSLRVGLTADLDAWRIARDDGSDVTFAMPRCVVRLAAAGGGDGNRHTVGAATFGPDPRLLWNEAAVDTFLRRAVAAARLSVALPAAPVHPAGSFPLVIDYALAKGLAHEAFGHAAEADSYRSSVLAEGGRFRTGLTVGAAHASVVDETLEGDHAWQPFSANGMVRRTVRIVDHGRLAGGLTDAWSAGPSGLPVTGSERAESFRHAPLPRMSNIRIEVDAPLPAGGTFEDYGPEEVRDLLARAGVFGRHPRVVFLSGYSGGQVNTATGDFMFNCKALYTLDDRGATLHRPAIFSGSMFGALHSIREAFGGLSLDALGVCGKWGQSVPSSGGSHWFLVLDPHPDVRVGGA